MSLQKIQYHIGSVRKVTLSVSELGVKVIRKNRKLLGSFNFLKDIFAKQQLFSKIIYYVLLEIRSTLLMIMPLTVKNCIAYTFYLSCLVIK